MHKSEEGATMTTLTMNGDGDKEIPQSQEGVTAESSSEESRPESREEKERRLYPHAPRKEEIPERKAKFDEDMQRRKDDLKKNNSLEDLAKLAETNPVAREAFDERFEEEMAAKKKENLEFLETLGVKPKPEDNQEQLMNIGDIIRRAKETEPDVLAAAIGNLGIDPSKGVQAIREQDPQKADVVQKILEDRGEVIKKLEDKPETEDEKLFREEKQKKGEELVDEMRDFQKEMVEMKLLDNRSGRDAVRAKIEKGKTYLRDIMSHHFFESKQFKLAKGGAMAIFFIAFYLALMLLTMEMNLLIAIGKGGGK